MQKYSGSGYIKRFRDERHIRGMNDRPEPFNPRISGIFPEVRYRPACLRHIMINDNKPLSELHWYAADGRMMPAVKPVSLTAVFYEADMTGFAPGLYLLQINGEMLRVVKR